MPEAALPTDATMADAEVLRDTDEPLPKKVVFGLSAGHGGMSVLINLLGIVLVFFYLPPESQGLPQFVSDATFLVVINAIVIIAAVGRLTDAVTDPLIAIFSDRSKHKLGRRIPFMRAGAIPAALAAFLMFFPPVGEQSGWNIAWLIGMQFVLYVALTAYVTPAFAMVADLGRTPEERLDLTTWTSVAWALGILVAAMTPFLTAVLKNGGMDPVTAWQTAIGIVCAIALVAMLVPVFTIDEPRWSRSDASAVSLAESLKVVFSNPFFRFYLAADFAYFCGLMIIQTGLLYYVTVLLVLEEELTAPLLGIMVVLAIVLYPVVNKWAKKGSGKNLVVFAFSMSAVVFAGIFFLGQYPLPAFVQALAVVVLFAVPFAILSVLPSWILSDIAEHSILVHGDAKTGMFYAARTFMQKISQTVGILVFALLTNFGRDIGDDLGIRLSGLAGVILYGVAAFLFRRYDEDQLQADLAAGVVGAPKQPVGD